MSDRRVGVSEHITTTLLDYRRHGYAPGSKADQQGVHRGAFDDTIGSCPSARAAIPGIRHQAQQRRDSAVTDAARHGAVSEIGRHNDVYAGVAVDPRAAPVRVLAESGAQDDGP